MRSPTFSGRSVLCCWERNVMHLANKLPSGGAFCSERQSTKSKWGASCCMSLTALSVKLMQQLAPHFDFVLWRSLQNAPPLGSLLAKCITFLSQQHKTDLPENVGERITLLIDYL